MRRTFRWWSRAALCALRAMPGLSTRLDRGAAALGYDAEQLAALRAAIG